MLGLGSGASILCEIRLFMGIYLMLSPIALFTLVT
jgi:hypothetical protein